MSQNVSLWGATYSNVPAIDVPKSGGGTATFTDVTDTTATASDVAQGKYFYTAAGTKTQGTGTSGGYITQDANGYVVLSPTNGVPTLTSKTITANGAYNASTDNVTGYSSVNVSVPGPTLISKSISTNGTYNASSDSADGYSSVSVNVPGGLSSLTAATATASGSDTYNYGTITFTVQAQPKAFRLVLNIEGFYPYAGGYSPIVYTYDGYRAIVYEIFYDGTNVSMLADVNGSVYFHLTPTFTYSAYGGTKYLDIDTRQSYPDYPEWYPRFPSGGITYELTYYY